MKQLLIVIFLCHLLPANAQRLMENLDRGIIAVYQGQGKVYVGWRMLGTDPENIAFNVYRKTGLNTIKLNAKPVTESTNYIDNYVSGAEYFVKVVLHGKEG